MAGTAVIPNGVLIGYCILVSEVADVTYGRSAVFSVTS